MDYQGQGRAEFLYEVIILICTVGGAIGAYIAQRFSYALYSHLAGLIISCIICLPPWPFFRRNPVKWQPPVKYDEINAGEQQQQQQQQQHHQQQQQQQPQKQQSPQKQKNVPVVQGKKKNPKSTP